ncbi:hypothetical protein KFE25_007235 [Diacronema lutheri]|uniref:CXXC-type domain-containing protein n=2 Tax=Diacronema lutheri TaxID=2081491 RepID=A0A8J5X2Y2_DIALT|nr:hypothetical protein KFE25_007235 [Diacronema lutheri]
MTPQSGSDAESEGERSEQRESVRRRRLLDEGARATSLPASPAVGAQACSWAGAGAPSALPGMAGSPQSLRAGGRLFKLPPGGVSARRPVPLSSSAPPRFDLAAADFHGAQHAKHEALLRAASLAAARVHSSGGDLTPSSPGMGAAKMDWHTHGNEHLGRYIARCVYDGAALAGVARARVIGFLPAAESDFEDALGRPQPLWLARFCAGSLLDGEEEELELHELLACIDDGGAGARARADAVHAREGAADGEAYGSDDLAAAGGGADSADGGDWEYDDGGGRAYGQGSGGAGVGGRRGKRRCGQCATCRADDCNACKFCKDKAKNGGANTLRRPCSARRPCRAPRHDQPNEPFPPLVFQIHSHAHAAAMAMAELPPCDTSTAA